MLPVLSTVSIANGNPLRDLSFLENRYAVLDPRECNHSVCLTLTTDSVTQLKTQILRSYSYLRQSAVMDPANMIRLIKSCIPPLDGTHHKGQAGRIGVVGGSLEYTGAPYFAGISALKVGADLVHIFCSTTAATVIKSYSPELIVHPLLDTTNPINEISPWLERLHVIVIGPGLGRDSKILNVVSELIKLIENKRIPLVIDADGLYLITENPELIKDFSSPVILTPNKIEFERLSNKLKGESGFAALGKNITILRKGETDELFSYNSELKWKYNTGGSGRRCGGQGDLLSGSIATFLHWTLSNIDKLDIGIQTDKSLLASSLSCFAASALIRSCNSKAFQVNGRSMLATDMIQHIHGAFDNLYEK